MHRHEFRWVPVKRNSNETVMNYFEWKRKINSVLVDCFAWGLNEIKDLQLNERVLKELLAHWMKQFNKRLLQIWIKTWHIYIFIRVQRSSARVQRSSEGCSVAQLGCSVAQMVARWPAVRQAWVWFPARHPYGGPSTEQQAMKITGASLYTSDAFIM